MILIAMMYATVTFAQPGILDIIQQSNEQNQGQNLTISVPSTIDGEVSVMLFNAEGKATTEKIITCKYPDMEWFILQGRYKIIAFVNSHQEEYWIHFN